MQYFVAARPLVFLFLPLLPGVAAEKGEGTVAQCGDRARARSGSAMLQRESMSMSMGQVGFRSDADAEHADGVWLAPLAKKASDLEGAEAELKAQVNLLADMVSELLPNSPTVAKFSEVAKSGEAQQRRAADQSNMEVALKAHIAAREGAIADVVRRVGELEKKVYSKSSPAPEASTQSAAAFPATFAGRLQSLVDNVSAVRVRLKKLQDKLVANKSSATSDPTTQAIHAVASGGDPTAESMNAGDFGAAAATPEQDLEAEDAGESAVAVASGGNPIAEAMSGSDFGAAPPKEEQEAEDAGEIDKAAVAAASRGDPIAEAMNAGDFEAAAAAATPEQDLEAEDVGVTGKSVAAAGEVAEACGKGGQSPVDIQMAAVDKSGPHSKLLSYMRFVPLPDRELRNSGKSVGVQGEFGTLELPDGIYTMKDFHFHFPSEHTVNGEHMAGEMQMVHTREGTDHKTHIAIVSLLLQLFEGEGDVQWFSDLQLSDGKLPAAAESSVPVGTVDLGFLSSLFNGGFVHYVGTTTTPPCVEGVYWYVLDKRGYISKAQVDAVKNIFPDTQNIRPTPSLDGPPLFANRIAVPTEFPVQDEAEEERGERAWP